MSSDLRERLADARLYLCTDARRSRGDLPRFLDAVLGAGVDIVQLREKGLEAGEELALLEVFARGLPAARPPAGGQRPGRRGPRGRRRRAPPGPGRPAGAGGAAHPRPRPAHRPQQPQPGSGRRGGRRARTWTTSAPGRCGPRRPSRAARRPAWACSSTSRGPGPGAGPGSRSAASAWTGSARCSRPGPPGWSWSAPSPRPTTRPPPPGSSPGAWRGVTARAGYHRPRRVM